MPYHTTKSHIVPFFTIIFSFTIVIFWRISGNTGTLVVTCLFLCIGKMSYLINQLNCHCSFSRRSAGYLATISYLLPPGKIIHFLSIVGSISRDSSPWWPLVGTELLLVNPSAHKLAPPWLFSANNTKSHQLGSSVIYFVSWDHFLPFLGHNLTIKALPTNAYGRSTRHDSPSKCSFWLGVKQLSILGPWQGPNPSRWLTQDSLFPRSWGGHNLLMLIVLPFLPP